MKPRFAKFTRSFLAFVLFAVCLSAAATQPNIIVILADDLGWPDLGVQGATDIRTPNIDSLATNGVRFRNGYVTAPVCSPSRAGLMTGRCQQRFGREMNPGPKLETNSIFGLPLTETTLGNRMKSLGYATGWIGKSHLGGDTNLYHPVLRGFDEYFGFLEGHHEYIYPYLVTTNDPIRRGYDEILETNYLTSAFERECLAFITNHASEPFFLYAPFNAVHFPMQATSNLFAGLDTNLFGGYTARYTNAAMIKGLDNAVGSILAGLRALNLESNTLIFFTSDNGAPNPAGPDANGSVNTPLRGYKAELYEGGIRVPFLMQWKGQLASNTVDALVSTLDILPTAVAAAGGSIQPAWQLDGVNLLPFLQGQTNALPHTNLFWRLETVGGEDVLPGPRAMRQGDWKLIKPSRDDNWELYDLATDISEATNVANAHPDVVQQLVAAYDDWNAQLAAPRWDFNTFYYVQPEFERDDIRLGSTNVSYLAPTFLPGGASVAFQDGASNLWVGAIDPLTGYFFSASGQDWLADTNLALLPSALNGPQWGLSTNASAIFYTKPGSNGLLQVWRSRVSGNSFTNSQLTGSATNSFGARVSQESTNASVKMSFSVGNISAATNYWADESAPAGVLPLPNHAGGSRNGNWLPGGTDLVYRSTWTNSPFTQIARYHTATGTAQIISTNSGDKTDVCGFLAPELNGELLYAAVVSHTNITLYRDLHDNTNGFYTALPPFAFPANAPQRFIYSFEPLPGLRGFNGVSYFSFAAFANNDPDNPGDSAMWLLGLGPDANHPIIRRLDADPQNTNNAAVAGRRDPKLFVGERGLFCYYSLADGANPVQVRLAQTGVKLPDYPGTPGGFTSLQFSRSFTAGTNDVNGNAMTPTEIMNLVAHNGRLYAGQSSTNFFPYPSNAEITNRFPTNINWSGAQILVKDSPTAPWRVDDADTNDLFRVHLRVDTLAEISLTTTVLGTPVSPPTNLLVCGLLDIGNIGSKLASARTRIDDTGRWYESKVTEADEAASAISFGAHMDYANGVHRIFAGLSNGQIHRGGFAPGLTNKLFWTTNAEYSGVGPVTGFAECEGKLYAACGLRQATNNPAVSGGLSVRDDASNSWSVVYRWPYQVEVFAAPEEDRIMRGLTTVREPHGASNDVLLAARSWPGVIERIDPAQQHTATIELDVRDFFARRWNDDRVRQARVIIAYNGFTAVTNPVSGEIVHLTGVWLDHPDLNSPLHNGTHFLIRHADATYAAADIANNLVGQLRATRCIAVSPFAEDRGASFYFGGYDVGSDTSTNTAWIMRGDWSTWPALSITRPNPPEVQLDWPITGTDWRLESSAVLGAGANWQTVPGLPTRSLIRAAQSVSAPEPASFFRLRKP
ncbi:MAG: hypothetical protein EXS35_15160 [Pedosphaera sp.]|nr:hypothetical protein [Pedosphaera sp.]